MWAAGVGGGHVQCFGTYFLKVKVPVPGTGSERIGGFQLIRWNGTDRNFSKISKFQRKFQFQFLLLSFVAYSIYNTYILSRPGSFSFFYYYYFSRFSFFVETESNWRGFHAFSRFDTQIELRMLL